MLAFLQPGWDFRQHRRNIAKIAGSTTSLAAFDRIQNEEAAHFLLNMLNSPDHLFDHLKTEAGAVILRITYGYTPNAQGPDPLVDMAERSMRDFGNAGTPGKYVVDLLPFCALRSPCLNDCPMLTLSECATCPIGVQAPASKPWPET
jgi:hypothetical protein